MAVDLSYGQVYIIGHVSPKMNNQAAEAQWERRRILPSCYLDDKVKNVSFVLNGMHVSALRLGAILSTRLGAYEDKRAVGTGSGRGRRWYLCAASLGVSESG